jgi:hypothetical protein
MNIGSNQSPRLELFRPLCRLARLRRLYLVLALVPVLLLLCVNTAHAAGLNDTGITDCWDDTGVADSSCFFQSLIWLG